MWYHGIGSSSFGRCYFGTGIREIHVPFIYGAPLDGISSVGTGFQPSYDYKLRPEISAVLPPEVPLPAEEEGASTVQGTQEGEESLSESVLTPGETTDDETSEKHLSLSQSGEVTGTEGGDTTGHESEG